MVDGKNKQPQAARPQAARLHAAKTFRVGRAVLVLALVGGAALAGGWVFRLPLAERFAGPLLEASVGVSDLKLTIDRLDTTGLVAREISLGADGGLRIARVAAAFTLAGLRRGRLERLVIDRAMVAAEFAGGRLRVAGLGEFGGAGSGGFPRLPTGIADWHPPADQIEIRDAVLAVSGPDGEITLSGGGTLRVTEPDFATALEVDLEVALAGNWAGTEVDVGGVVRAGTTNGRNLDGSYNVGEISVGPASADVGFGTFRLTGGGNFLTGGSYRGLTIGETVLGDGTGAVAWTQDGLNIQTSLGANFGHLRASLTGSVDGLLAGTGQASFGVRDWAFDFGSVAVDGVTGTLAGSFDRDGDELQFTPSPETRIEHGTVTGDSGWSLVLTAPLILTEDEGQVLRYRLGGKVGADLTSASVALTAEFDGGPGPFPITTDRLTAAINGSGGLVGLGGATIAAPGLDLAAAGIGADISWGEGGGLTGRMAVGQLRHTGAPAYFAPLGMDLNLTTGPVGTVLVEGRATGALGGRFNLMHDPARGAGTLSATLDQITLTPGGVRLDHVFPVLGGTTAEIDGTLDMSAAMSWEPRSVTSSGDLIVALASAETSEWQAADISGAVHFDDLFALTTPPGQEISVGRLDIGLPVTQARLEFELKSGGPGPRFAIARIAGLDLFGGVVASDPFDYVIGSDDLEILLRASGLQLDQVLRSADLGRLNSTGALGGEIPIRVIDGEVAVRGGRLRADPGGGVITYGVGAAGSAAAAENASLALVLEALRNFHYEDVAVTLDEGEAEEMAVVLTLAGRNPDLYGGKPLVFHIAINGPLREILNRGSQTLTLPTDTLRELGVFDRP